MKSNKIYNNMKKNDTIDSWFDETSAKIDATEQFSDEIFESLPSFFNSLVSLFTDKQQQATALFSSIVLISGVLPNYKVVYDDDILEANLFGYIYGAAGSGKGAMKKCKELLLPIHNEKKERAAQAFQKYTQALKHSKKTKEDPILTDNKGPALIAPPDELLFLPANTTKSNIYTLMAANTGVVICEPEAMTLSTALKQEHGAFTDLLLQAFHHETFSYSRKSERTIEIQQPCLSILLSSTPRHVPLFFNNTENGLYSRFIFLQLNSSSEFRDPFVRNKHGINKAIEAKAQLVKKVYDNLSKCKDAPLYFRLTRLQGNKMVAYFKPLLVEYKELFDDELDAVVKRYGVIFTRIAMILSIFETYENEDLKEVEEIVCTDTTFNCTLLIIQALFNETLKVYEMLARTQKNSCTEASNNSLEEKMEKQKKCVELYLAGYSLGKIAEQVLGNASSKPTVFRWLRKLGVKETKRN